MQPARNKWGRIGVIFVVALALNFAWEEAHSVLYLHFQGGAITDGILFRAALFDAAVITAVLYPFARLPSLGNKLWVAAAALLLFSVGLERWALEAGRWAYAPSMPVIPFLGSGLTPTAQLALLSYLSYKFSSPAVSFLFPHGAEEAKERSESKT